MRRTHEWGSTERMQSAHGGIRSHAHARGVAAIVSTGKRCGVVLGTSPWGFWDIHEIETGGRTHEFGRPHGSDGWRALDLDVASYLRRRAVKQICASRLSEVLVIVWWWGSGGISRAEREGEVENASWDSITRISEFAERFLLMAKSTTIILSTLLTTP